MSKAELISYLWEQFEKDKDIIAMNLLIVQQKVILEIKDVSTKTKFVLTIEEKNE